MCSSARRRSAAKEPSEWEVIGFIQPSETFFRRLNSGEEVTVFDRFRAHVPEDAQTSYNSPILLPNAPTFCGIGWHYFAMGTKCCLWVWTNCDKAG